MNGHPHLGRRSLRDKTMKNPIFLSVVAILSSVLFGTVHAGKFKSYEDCILESMKGVTSDLAAAEITKACRSKFPKRTTQLVEIDRDDWDIKDAKAEVHNRTSEGHLVMGLIYLCGDNGCGKLEFLNKSDHYEIKKLLVVVRFKRGTTSVEKEYYAEKKLYSLSCSPHQNCEFTFPVSETTGTFNAWWIKRVWGVRQH